MPDRRTTRFRVPPVTEFISVEALGGIVLLGATLGALVWANVEPDSYGRFWSRDLTLGWGSASLTEDLRHWINDGLMSVFFFVVALEIKRELVRGELADRRAASLPILAALGGMVVPASLYVGLNAGGPGTAGWGIPMATDIAFAVAVLAVLGAKLPSGLKIFLLTLAIVDDVGAILVIAIFYSDGISYVWLAYALVAFVGVVAMRVVPVSSPLFFVVPAAVLWVCVLESGVHATIAGVVLGLVTPARPVRGRPVIETLEHTLHPWSSFLVVPLFALANAGVRVDPAALRDAAGSAVAWGIVVGLVIGKPVGIVSATVIGVRTRLGRLPDGLGIAHVAAAGVLAGIGFTVSLFVAGLAFTGDALDEAKIAILVASVISGTAGSVALLVVGRRRPAPLGARAHDEPNREITSPSPAGRSEELR